MIIIKIYGDRWLTVNFVMLEVRMEIVLGRSKGPNVEEVDEFVGASHNIIKCVLGSRNNCSRHRINLKTAV